MLRQVEESTAARVVVAAACQYEVVAITTGLVPTITSIDKRHPVIGLSIITALVWHFRPH